MRSDVIKSLDYRYNNYDGQKLLKRGKAMEGLHDAAQLILQILSNHAWSGVSSICSLIGIPLAILLARKSKTNPPILRSYTLPIKKISIRSSK